jgi:translation initiation factor IF-2
MVKKGQKKIENFLQRPPVVVVLGHVDHGKSSLLEAIRDFKITSKEFGGITQHIGAYEVVMDGQKKITFIDTPGHEAFSAMRARGARVADIALLVVDAAQSVQPQTKEAIVAIKRAEIPMIVVINKIDLPNAEPEKIKRELLKIDVIVESMGGNITSVNVSAKEKKGIDELLDMILLVADMQNLESEDIAPIEGLIIESYIDGSMGPIATAIIKKGTLRKKDIIATDLALAKVKGLKDFQGRDIEEAKPSQPVIILGFEKVPAVGEKFKGYISEK